MKGLYSLVIFYKDDTHRYEPSIELTNEKFNEIKKERAWSLCIFGPKGYSISELTEMHKKHLKRKTSKCQTLVRLITVHSTAS